MISIVIGASGAPHPIPPAWAKRAHGQLPAFLV